MSRLRIGTRASDLATTHAGQVAARLGEHELVGIGGGGDLDQTTELAACGGKDAFVGALRAALLRGEVDAVVHPFQDLPATPADGIELAAVPKRADARDAFCSVGGAPLADLLDGARVGTGSPRRRAQLLAARPQLEVVPIRGDVDARLGRLTTDDADRRLDGIVLAAADLAVLDRSAAASELFALSDWPTAPAQGALAIEIRADASAALRRRIARVDHRPSRLAASAERAVLARLEAGCGAPVAATALLEDGLLFLTATVYAPDGSDAVTASHAAYPEDSRDPAGELGARVAEELLAHGAASLAPELPGVGA
ncbi:MAG TPA: hydroxymethylbilane synthase [Microbacteriaceae bacterium]|nr:hydroxymethylbilane synthase [Microbacteriaceae bacterium]